MEKLVTSAVALLLQKLKSYPKQAFYHLTNINGHPPRGKFDGISLFHSMFHIHKYESHHMILYTNNILLELLESRNRD